MWKLRVVSMLACVLALFGQETAAGVVYGDFDGDGFQDLATGCPEATVREAADAGLVHVVYGGPDGLNPDSLQTWHQGSIGILGTVDAADRFGEALAAGNFNGDINLETGLPIDDLAVGVPGENAGGGMVNVLYGSPLGLTASNNQLWNKTELGRGLPEVSDGFGSALAAGNFGGKMNALTGLPIDDLAIGVPRDDFGAGIGVGSTEDRGTVHIVCGSPAGLIREGNQIWSQSSPGIAGEAEQNDLFGSALATGNFNGDRNDETGFPLDDLAIGVPGENLGLLGDEGAVNVIYGSFEGLTAVDDQIWHQDSEGIKGEGDFKDSFGSALAAGNFNGDVSLATGLPIDDLAIGVPGEKIGILPGLSNSKHGTVNVIYGSPSGLISVNDQVWNQNSDGIKGSSEGFDRLGSALAAGNFNGDLHPETGASIDDLAIGVPNEDLDGGTDAGLVNLLYGSVAGLTEVGDQIWHQDSFGIEGEAESGDLFGAGLASGHAGGFGFAEDRFADLAVQVRDGEFGAVNVIYGADVGPIPESDDLLQCEGQSLVSLFQVVNAASDFPIVVDGGLGENEWSGFEPWAFTLNGELRAVEPDDPEANVIVYSAIAPVNDNAEMALCSMYAFDLGASETCREGDFVADVRFPALLDGNAQGQVITSRLRGATDPVPCDDDVCLPSCPVDVTVDLDGDGAADAPAEDLGIAAAAGFGFVSDVKHLLVEICVPEGILPSGPFFTIMDLASDGMPTLASSALLTVDNGVLTATTSQTAARIASVSVGPGTPPSPINLASNGVVDVAILTTPVFDATEVDPISVQLVNPRDLSRRATQTRAGEQDVDGDRIRDLVVRFHAADLAANGVLTETSDFVLVVGDLITGESFAGFGAVRIVPPDDVGRDDGGDGEG